MADWYKSKATVEAEVQLQAKRNRLRELRRQLDETDHKTFADYEPKEGEDVEAIKSERREWRREVRELIAEGVGQEDEEA